MSIEIRTSGSNASDPDAKNKNNVEAIGDVAAELFRFRSALPKQSPAQFAPISVVLKRCRGYTVRQESNPQRQADNKSDCHRRFQNYPVARPFWLQHLSTELPCMRRSSASFFVAAGTASCCTLPPPRSQNLSRHKKSPGLLPDRGNSNYLMSGQRQDTRRSTARPRLQCRTSRTCCPTI